MILLSSLKDKYQGRPAAVLGGGPSLPTDVPAFHYPLADHFRTWQEECKNSVPHPERIRVMSGPLINLFETFRQ